MLTATAHGEVGGVGTRVIKSAFKGLYTPVRNEGRGEVEDCPRSRSLVRRGRNRAAVTARRELLKDEVVLRRKLLRRAQPTMMMMMMMIRVRVVWVVRRVG